MNPLLLQIKRKKMRYTVWITRSGHYSFPYRQQLLTIMITLLLMIPTLTMRIKVKRKKKNKRKRKKYHKMK